MLLGASIWHGLAIALFTAVVGSLLAWLVGTQVSFVWDERRRRREGDLAALRAFYELYGKWFSTWKLWSSAKHYGKTVETPEHLQWRLLERAEEAEGGFEALLVKLVAERQLNETESQLLGCFREGYQMLRESIRENKHLDWWASPKHRGDGYAQYRSFKALTAYVAFLLEASPKGRLRPAAAFPEEKNSVDAFLDITRPSTYQDAWWEIAADLLHLPAVEKESP